ncbi:hypothetical protein ACJX0J_015838, partial [Zea mays]
VICNLQTAFADRPEVLIMVVALSESFESLYKTERGSSVADVGGAADRVLNQLLTEMDGMNAKKTGLVHDTELRSYIFIPSLCNCLLDRTCILHKFVREPFRQLHTQRGRSTANSPPPPASTPSRRLVPALPHGLVRLQRALKETFSVDVSAAGARPLRVPLTAPFTIAASRLAALSNVAVRVELCSGAVGWGEAPVLPSVTTTGMYEARLWLCATVSLVHSLSDCGQRDLFLDLLERKNSRRDVAARLLRMIFDKKPRMVGSILARKGHILEDFFRGNPNRIMQWFGHFAVTGESTHRKGAKALLQFAFVNCDRCWEELEWKGKHGQSPAVVATKPHYFNFLEYVPDFWSSDELANSIKDGEILQIDEEYFVDKFLYLMYEENSKDVWHVVEDFLMDEQFSSLCQHLLIHLDEERLLGFLNSLGKLINPTMQCKELTFPCCWLEVLLSGHYDHISLDDLVFLNCVTAKGRQLWRLMNDEEQHEEWGQMEELLKGVNHLTDADHFALMKELVETELPGVLKWNANQEILVNLFFSHNKIEFHKADDYSLVRNYGFSISHMPDIDVDWNLMRTSDELLELGSSDGKNGVESQRGSWRLSTDGFSASWDI